MVVPSDEVNETAVAQARKLAAGLYPHQIDGVAFLLARRRSILADDMGLGKTRQSIVAMTAAEPIGPWLVVCPASVKRNWQREINIVDAAAEVVVVDRKNPVPGKSYRGWVVINYDIVKKNADALGNLPLTGFVFDEAHYLRNHRSQRSKASRSLLDQADSPMVHCLTGTPMLNRPRDLFPLLQLVNHSLGKSFLGFAKRYCDATKGDFGWETKGASNLEELTVQLHGTMLRRTKDEVLDLPGKMRTWLTVEIPETTARRGMRRILATLMKEASEEREPGKEHLPPVSRPKLIARLAPVRSEIAGAKMKHSVEFVKGIVEQGEKVVLYTCFQEVAETFLEEFESKSVRLITGGVEPEDRQQAVDDFQNNDDIRVLVATVIAGGVGITLTAARTVVFNDLDWVPANHWQAEDRAYRIGQTHPVNVYYFKAANSIDEFVGQVLESKSNIISAVVDGKSLVDATANVDVFGEFERTIRSLDVNLSGRPSNEDIATALDQAVAVYAKEAVAETGAASDPLHKPAKAKVAAIRALARALVPPKTVTKYRIESSKAGQYYEIEVDGTDVICSCRGFEFRGQCKHARTLKDALANDGNVPDGYERLV